MESIPLFLTALALSATSAWAPPATPRPEPVMRANAASRNALEESLARYHPPISKYRLPSKLASQAVEHHRRVHGRSLVQNPEQRFEVVQPIAEGNKVAVHGRVTRLPSGETVDELAVYVVEATRIGRGVYVERLPQAAVR